MGPPVRVSRDGRHFTDHDGRPSFWLGDTQWELFRAFQPDEARRLLERRAAQGFSAVMVMLLGVGASGNADGPADGTCPNVNGEKPWKDGNPLAPNEAYFRTADAVVRHAAEAGVTLVIGVYHGRTGVSNPIGMHNARAWARWVGARYRAAPGVIWSMYPRAEPASLGVARELARGLREGDGGAHLVSLHPDPSPASSSLFHRERWLAFNTIQTYKFVERVVPLIEANRARRPRKPVVMAEGAYEAGIEYGFPVTPLWVRRQAYYSFLAGASHGYGHNDCWRAWPSWERALEAPGAVQLGVLRRAITGRCEWWRLEPDPSLIREGAWHVGDVLTLAARHPGGDWLLFYLADRFECVVDLGRAGPAGSRRAFWIDPRSGEQAEADAAQRGSTATIRLPAGWEEGLLVVERAERPGGRSGPCWKPWST